MVRRLALAVVACGCGRIGLDETVTATAVSLSYPEFELVAVRDASQVALTPTATGEELTFSVAPALPAGLSLDPSTGVLAGTPTANVDRVSFAITAAGPGGSATFSLLMLIEPGSIVDSTADGADDDGGTDATCLSTPSGGCTLRAAVQTANHRTTPYLVLLDATTYVLGSALDPITNDVIIAGAPDTTTLIRPTAMHPGYGMASLATAHALELLRLRVDGFGPVNGAAVSVTAGVLSVSDSLFSNNTSAGSGGVFFISNGATATINTSAFVGNTSFGGCCGGWGGVIDGEMTGTTIAVKRSTAANNQAAWGSFSHITTGTTLTLENSTLYGNTAVTAGTLATPGGVYFLTNDTIAFNTNSSSTPDSAGIYEFMAPCHYTIANTIVAFNTDATGAQNNCNRRDLTATITSQGGNIISDAGGNCAAYFTSAGDRLATDPSLASGGPANNGGPTGTILLVAPSPAVGGGVTTSCPANDQRGLPRPAPSKPPHAACDVGAVEMQ